MPSLKDRFDQFMNKMEQSKIKVYFHSNLRKRTKGQIYNYYFDLLIWHLTLGHLSTVNYILVHVSFCLNAWNYVRYCFCKSLYYWWLTDLTHDHLWCNIRFTRRLKSVCYWPAQCLGSDCEYTVQHNVWGQINIYM